MTGLRAVVVAAAVLWPLALGAAVAGRHSGGGIWSTMVYLAAGQVCHQQPARSFTTASVSWPVCARCSGLYLAAPLGALLALRNAPRGPRRRGLAPGVLLMMAAVPTAVTLGLEWPELAPVSNAARALAALPLGAAAAFVCVGVLGGPAASIRYTGRA